MVILVFEFKKKKKKKKEYKKEPQSCHLASSPTEIHAKTDHAPRMDWSTDNHAKFSTLLSKTAAVLYSEEDPRG